MPFATGLVNRLSQGLDTRIQDRRQEQQQQRQFQQKMQQQQEMLPIELERQQAIFEQQQQQMAQAFPQTLEHEKARLKMKYELEKTLAEGSAHNVSPEVLEAFKTHDIESMLSLARTPKDQKFVDRAYKMVFSHAERMEELKAMSERGRSTPKGRRSIVEGMAREEEPTRMSELPLANQQKIKTFNSQIGRIQRRIEKERDRLVGLELRANAITGSLSPEDEVNIKKEMQATLKSIGDMESELADISRRRDVAAGRTGGEITDEEKVRAAGRSVPSVAENVPLPATRAQNRSIAELAAERTRQLTGGQRGDPKKAVSLKDIQSLLEDINRRLDQ